MDWAFRRALGLTLTEGAPLSNGREWLSSVMPSGNIVSTAEQMGRFFELLLRGGELDGVRIFAPEAIRVASQRTTGFEFDGTIGLPIRYGHGMMLGSRWISPFGPRVEQAFGHLGLSNVHVWADPERDLSVALLTSGKAVLAHHIPALWGILRAVSDFPAVR
jgi:CubicO group peptidase (beta-lactamase class C family)